MERAGLEPENPRSRMASGSYEELRLKVLRRDGWKCQNCGSAQNLQVHHQTFRSQCGKRLRVELDNAVRDVSSESTQIPTVRMRDVFANVALKIPITRRRISFGRPPAGRTSPFNGLPSMKDPLEKRLQVLQESDPVCRTGDRSADSSLPCLIKNANHFPVRGW